MRPCVRILQCRMGHGSSLHYYAEGSRTWRVCSSFLPPALSFLLPVLLSSSAAFLPPYWILTTNTYRTPVGTEHQALGLGQQDLEPTWGQTPGTDSGLGRKIPQRVKPRVTGSQINSAPPNTPQSSLVTACWTAGPSPALISPASVLGQATIFHVLKTDDPRVREMKAPFNRSAWGSAGKEGEGQSSSSVRVRTGPEHVPQRPRA